MKVSIIVALYNKEEWISQAIESVLKQKYKDWEMIIVDDGSSDKSGNIADDYAQKDERIKVFHRKIIMRRDSVIFYIDNNRIDNADRRCLSI